MNITKVRRLPWSGGIPQTPLILRSARARIKI